MTDNKKLQEIRSRIDLIDKQLQDLITERAGCAKEVAGLKDIVGDTSEYYRPEREAQVLQAVVQRNRGPLSDECMARLFREIMSACLYLQHPMKVAYLGPEGTYTQAAVSKHFGSSVETVPLGTIDEVFREVEANAAHYGVVPIENSTEGAVSHTLDMFVNSDLNICSEVELRIHHYLLSKDNDLSQIKRIYGHQMALSQCREWLDANAVKIERIALNSNAEAAQRASHEPGTAAIAGVSAAEIYQLNRLAANIEDKQNNTTRFLVIGRQMPASSGHDKTSLLVSAANKSGALYRLLKPLSEHNITLTRIESRPSRQGMWEYVFFIDIEGHIEDANVASALQDFKSEAAMIKVLGSYPCAVL